jgi:uncharacterized phage-associated protein
MAISFRANQDKILEALVLSAETRPGVDVLHLCKVFYFADKRHLNSYGRPIFGDKYWALKQGPVPSLTYDMIERDETQLNGDLLSQLSDALSFYKAETDDYLRLKAKRQPRYEVFSDSDLECLRSAIDQFASMDVDELTKLAHDEPAYKATFKPGVRRPAQIPYEQIIDAKNPFYDELIRDLRENATSIVL